MTALNHNDSEYKSKIKQNLDIFFKEDKYVNHTIDNEIKKLIHHFNDFKINSNDLKKVYFMKLRKIMNLI